MYMDLLTSYLYPRLVALGVLSSQKIFIGLMFTARWNEGTERIMWRHSLAYDFLNLVLVT